jgi:hypothetical protein
MALEDKADRWLLVFVALLAFWVGRNLGIDEGKRRAENEREDQDEDQDARREEP